MHNYYVITIVLFQYPNYASSSLSFLIAGWFKAFLFALISATFLLWYVTALVFLFSSNFSIRFYLFHPISLDKSPKTQNLRSFFILTSFKASGTTYFFLESYGAGTPSKTFRRPEKVKIIIKKKNCN